MSKCITSAGEYGEHQMPATSHPFLEEKFWPWVCGRCDALDVEAVIDAHAALEAKVEAFINQRPEYVTALRNTRGDGDQSDYYRWSGHAEARRQLATTLGVKVPHEPGERTSLATPREGA